MVFILAALQEFNGIDMRMFIERSWKKLNDAVSASDLDKTLVHLCVSHFMNTCKKYVEKKTGKKEQKRIFIYDRFVNKL